MNLENLKKSLNTDTFRDLRRYLISKLIYLDRVSSIKELKTPINQAVEFKAHKKSVAILKEILKELGFLEQAEESDIEEKVKQIKKELGL